MNHRESAKQPFIKHLIELRNRTYTVVIVFILGSLIGYYIYGTLLKILLAPLKQTVYYTSPIGGFNFSLQISLLFGIFLAIPVFTYHLFHFIAPALPEAIEKKLMPLTIASFLLMVIGVIFSYYVGLPASLHFFATFSSGDIKSLISASDYLTFAIRYLFGFGILFQLPVLLITINYIKQLKAKTLLSYQRHAIVVAFILGLILSPAADPLNMTLMAIPLIILFYLSVLFVALINMRRRKKLVTDASINQDLVKPESLLSTICYFIVTLIVSALFGIASLFAYATYQNVQKYNIPVNKLFMIPDNQKQFLDNIFK